MAFGERNRGGRGRRGAADVHPHVLEQAAPEIGDQRLVVDDENAVAQLGHDSTGRVIRISVRMPLSLVGHFALQFADQRLDDAAAGARPRRARAVPARRAGTLVGDGEDQLSRFVVAQDHRDPSGPGGQPCLSELVSSSVASSPSGSAKSSPTLSAQASTESVTPSPPPLSRMLRESSCKKGPTSKLRRSCEFHELVMDEPERIDATAQPEQPVARLEIVGPARLQDEQAVDDLQIVLDAVIDLAQQHVALTQRMGAFLDQPLQLLLGVQQRLFGVVTGVDVLDRRHREARGVAFPRLRERGRDPNPERGSVAAPVALHGDIDRGLAREQARIIVLADRPVLGPGEVAVGTADDLVRLAAEHRRESAIDAQEAPGRGLDQRLADHRALEAGAEFGFAARERALGDRALGEGLGELPVEQTRLFVGLVPRIDVLDRRHGEGRVIAAGRPRDRRRNARPERGSVAPHVALLVDIAVDLAGQQTRILLGARSWSSGQVNSIPVRPTSSSGS